jgi:hypothetical protein
MYCEVLKAENVDTDRSGKTSEQKCHAKKKQRINQKRRLCMYIDTANVEHEMYDCTGIGATGIVTKV